MDIQERLRFEMMIRVRDFGAKYVADFPADSLGGESFSRVADAVTQLERFATEKVSRFNSTTQKRAFKSAARAALLEDLQAISRTAAFLAVEIPGLENKFRVPTGVGERNLLIAARAIANDVEPFAERFVRLEMPPTFLDDLRADIAAFETAVTERDAAASETAESRSAIDEAIDGGMEHVKRLNVLIRNRFRDNARVLSAWTQASHVERAPRAAAPKPQAAATTTA